MASFFLLKISGSSHAKEKKKPWTSVQIDEILRASQGEGLKDVQLGLDRQSNILCATPLLAGLARDFIKVESAFIRQESHKGFFNDIEKFEVLYREENGEGSVHAEMKVLGYLLSEGIIGEHSTENEYIGISKLCCSKCELIIKITNEVKNEVKKVPPVLGVGALQSETIILTRGEHGLGMRWKWTPPRFLSAVPSSPRLIKKTTVEFGLLKRIADKYREYIGFQKKILGFVAFNCFLDFKIDLKSRPKNKNKGQHYDNIPSPFVKIKKTGSTGSDASCGSGRGSCEM